MSAGDERVATGTEADEPSLKDLRQRSVTGGIASIATSFGRVAIQLATTVVLARLLTPPEFGLVALSAAAVGFLGLFVDPGFSLAMVQRQRLEEDQASSLFWTNVGLGLLLALAAMAVGALLAELADDPTLAVVTTVFGLSYFVQTCGVIQQGLLKRRLEFLRLSAIDFSATATGAIAGVLAALAGAHVYALVVGPLVTQIVAVSLVWRSARWLPSRPRRGSAAEPLLHFARDVTGYNVLNYFARNADNLLLGVTWGAGPLGHYSRAYALAVTPVAQFTNALGGVAGPALSRLQSRPEAYRAYSMRALTLIALATLPPLLAACILADDVVLLVLGPQWVESTVLLRLLAAAALFQPVLSVCGWHYVCLARTHALRIWGLVSVVVTVAAFCVGLPWGTVGVALSYAIGSNALLLPGALWAVRGTPVAFRDVVAAVRSPLAAAAIFGCVVGTVRWLAAPLGSVAAVILCLLAGGASLAAAAFVMPTLRSALALALATVSWRQRA